MFGLPKSVCTVPVILILVVVDPPLLRVAVEGPTTKEVKVAMPGVLSTWLAEAPPYRETSRGPV